jgi:hypothetical protein
MGDTGYIECELVAVIVKKGIELPGGMGMFIWTVRGFGDWVGWVFHVLGWGKVYLASMFCG